MPQEPDWQKSFLWSGALSLRSWSMAVVVDARGGIPGAKACIFSVIVQAVLQAPRGFVISFWRVYELLLRRGIAEVAHAITSV